MRSIKLPVAYIITLSLPRKWCNNMAVNRFTELATTIAENTKTVTDYLTSKGLSAPSFDVDGLDEFPIPPNDKEAFTARLNVIAATKELHDLAVGPREGLRYLAWDVCLLFHMTCHTVETSYQGADSLSLYGVSHYKIAEAIPIHEEISYVDLSKKVNLDLTNLRRIVRHATTNHIFHEPRKGYVAHTRTSRLLAEDIKMQAWVAMYVEDLYRPNAYTIEAMDKMARKPRNY
jgi:hypothetical protein